MRVGKFVKVKATQLSLIKTHYAASCNSAPIPTPGMWRSHSGITITPSFGNFSFSATVQLSLDRPLMLWRTVIERHSSPSVKVCFSPRTRRTPSLRLSLETSPGSTTIITPDAPFDFPQEIGHRLSRKSFPTITDFSLPYSRIPKAFNPGIVGKKQTVYTNIYSI